MSENTYKKIQLVENVAKSVGEGVDEIASEERLMASFVELVHTYKDPLYCVLLRMMGQQEMAELLLKQAFVKIYELLPDYDGTIHLKNWVYSIVIAYWRERKEYPQDVVVLKDVREQQLELLIARLPETERLIFLLHYAGECSYEEIAEIMQMSVLNVQNKLHMAKKQMRDEVREARE